MPDGNIRWDGLPRRAFCEESPDRKGHFTAEIADRGNLVDHVTENNRTPMACKGENVRQELTTGIGDNVRVRT